MDPRFQDPNSTQFLSIFGVDFDARFLPNFRNRSDFALLTRQIEFDRILTPRIGTPENVHEIDENEVEMGSGIWGFSGFRPCRFSPEIGNYSLPGLHPYIVTKPPHLTKPPFFPPHHFQKRVPILGQPNSLPDNFNPA